MADDPNRPNGYGERRASLREIAEEGLSRVPDWRAVDRNIPDSKTLAKIAAEAKMRSAEPPDKPSVPPTAPAMPPGGDDGVKIVENVSASWTGDGGYAYTIDTPTGDIRIDESPDGRFDGKVVKYDGEMGSKAWRAIMREAQRRGIVARMFRKASGGGGGPLAQMTPEV